jgi:uncharacterized protein (DUF433 family)
VCFSYRYKSRYYYFKIIIKINICDKKTDDCEFFTIVRKWFLFFCKKQNINVFLQNIKTSLILPIMIQQVYITRNPNIMLGKPTIKGTRITVELIVRKMAGGYSIDELLVQYPHLQKIQIIAALEYAAMVIANEEILEVA